MARIAMIVWNEFLNDARVLKEAETLQGAGHQVVVHALHSPGVTQEAETLASGVEVVRVRRNPFSRSGRSQTSRGTSGETSRTAASPGLRYQLMRLATRSAAHLHLCWRLIRERADVIHAHDVNTLPTGWLAARLSGARLVYDAHEISTDREGYRSLRKAVGWVEKYLMPRAAATITTTDARAKFFARAYGIERPLVLQNRPRRIAPKRTDLLRQELGLADDRPIILYQGGLQAGRGLARLVAAAEQVEKASFVLIGGGLLEAELKAQVATAGLQGRVHFIDTVSLARLPDYTASADIGVQPIENTCLNHLTTDSNKLFEYMMAGLPVVASNFPEIRKVVEQAGFGLLIPEGNTDALATALNALVVDKRMRQTMSGNAIKAAEDFNWEAQEADLIGLYARVLGTQALSSA